MNDATPVLISRAEPTESQLTAARPIKCRRRRRPTLKQLRLVADMAGRGTIYRHPAALRALESLEEWVDALEEKAKQ
jgi:hypothetical protein